MIPIPHEQFTYGLKGNSYKFQPTDKVKKLLHPQSLRTLTGLTLQRNQKRAVIEKWFPTENVATVTVLTRELDDYPRSIVVNHTYIFKIEDYLSFFPPSKLLEEKVTC